MRQVFSVRSWPPWLAFAAWLIGLAGQLLLDDPRRRFPAYAALGALAFGGWLFLGFSGARGRLPSLIFALTLGGSLCFRGWGLALTPAFSEDVFRYLYEGAVALERGPGFPFLHPPDAGPRLGLPPGLIEEGWLRINHASIPTIYPPFAQAVFMLNALLAPALGISALLGLKLLLVLAELSGSWLLWRALVRRGRAPAALLFAIACPSLILEVAREGHADSLAFLGLALFASAFSAARPRLGYFGLALAALAKLNGLVALPAALRSTRAGALWSLPVFALLLLPLAFAGPAAFGGLFEYTTRWRAGDGVFSLLLLLSEWILGGDYVQVGAYALTRHVVARAFSFSVFVGLSWAVLHRPVPVARVPEVASTLLLLLLLLSPTLHPWYTVWLLPFLVLGSRDEPALAALVSLAWLGHHASWLDLGPGWTDVPAVRALVHTTTWGCFLLPRLLARRSGGMLRAPSGGEAWDSKRS